jgi:hypothetical protein
MITEQQYKQVRATILKLIFVDKLNQTGNKPYIRY